jgi:tetratricopeptide (TPR) repeat protein
MRVTAVFLILFVFCGGALLPKSNPWGEIKKIYFYDSVGDYDKVLTHLENIRFDPVKRTEQKEIAAFLIRFGDYYLEKGKYKHSEAFYRKVLDLSNDYWYVYNKLDKISRAVGSTFFSFKHLFGQWVMIVKNFSVSFLMMNHTFNILFFSGLLVFFLFGVIMFIKYFRLAGNDLIIGEKGTVSIVKAVIVIAVALWPIFFIAGWMIFPFLISGFLWFYLKDNEKKAVIYMLITVTVVTLLYAMNVMLEKNFRTPEFNTIRQVYSGHLFEKEDYDTFDTQLKIAQALSYYENGRYDTALDILNSTGDDYKDTLKYDLMGNIYYRYGDMNESTGYYRESLRLDDKNKIALNNFTLVLLKANNPTVFNSYAKRYPEIDKLRLQELQIKEVKLKQGVLWKRLFSSSEATFKPGTFLGGVVTEFFRLPIIYFMILFVVYIVAMKKITPNLGDSTYCSKCSKILKEASVHRSYKLCDECYQLFSIKDVIFLEAKIIKERELRKKFRKKYVFLLLFSLLIPGLNFNQRENNRLFLLLSMIFYFLAGFAVIGVMNFNRAFSVAPLFFNLIGMAAIGFYFLVNIISVIGDEDGF